MKTYNVTQIDNRFAVEKTNGTIVATFSTLLAARKAAADLNTQLKMLPKLLNRKAA